MTSIPAYPQLLEMLGDLRRQWRARQVTEGLLLAAAIVGAVLLVTVAADNLFKFGAAGRSVLGVIFWASVIAAPVGLVIGRWLTKRRDDFFAPEVAVCCQQAYILDGPSLPVAAAGFYLFRPLFPVACKYSCTLSVAPKLSQLQAVVPGVNAYRVCMVFQKS